LGELIRSHDWSATPLGPIETWPRSLKTCVQIMLTSRQPIWIGWGKELIKLYNDPYREIVQGKHPWALGKPAYTVWKDIWRDIDPMLQKVMLENEGTYVEEQLLIMQRNGYPEETYYTFSYTPVAGDDGKTGGMICFNTDDTERIISERQLKTLTQLGKRLNDLKLAEHTFQESISVLKDNPHDFPFALLYRSDGDDAKLVASTEPNTVFENKHATLTLDSRDEITILVSGALESNNLELLDGLHAKVGDMPKGAWEISPDKAIILPIAQRGHKQAYGFLIVGANPFRPLDEKYLGFFQLVADQIATSLANIEAIEAERKRLEAMAEIDRAKTAFFSNISHEFRTPLTLMLGSMEDLFRRQNETIASNINTVDTAHRNSLRLLRLVNNLLDFSKIEAGREQASFQRVDIASFTRQLASNFSSLVENAGLIYTTDIDPIPDEVYLDRVMWEKIVLNLISNAFKYTLKGHITVSLKLKDKAVTLSVKDTGVGIPKAELPKMFQRFHRVQNTTGRTHEGTGIGLSLVSELVKLHSGTISVTSEVGVGSEFMVTIPVGRAHLDASTLNEVSDDIITPLTSSFESMASTLIDASEEDAQQDATVTQKGKIIVVDDNSDMRRYIKQLLQNDFQVITSVNGEDALQKIAQHAPELVLSDIMMPVMDGVQLMQAIKSNPSTKSLPVILLSARAGEEARIVGYETGADDYLVKPFSANELIARIKSQFNLARIRKEVESNLKNLIQQSPVAMALLRGPSLTVELINAGALEIWGKSYKDVINKPLALAMPEIVEQGFIDLLTNVYTSGDTYRGNEVPIELIRFGNVETRYINFIYSQLRDDNGDTIGLVGVGVDVTDQVSARKVIEETKIALNNAVELAELGTWEINLENSFTTYSPRVAGWWGLPVDGAPLDKVISCMHPDDRPKVSVAVENAINQTGHYEAEYRLINAVTKEERFIEANGNVSYDKNHKPVKLNGIVRDITLQKLTQQELERQVQERTIELQVLNTDLKKSNNELMQFAYVASHDLQEPLRKIQTFSDLARNDGSSGHVKAYLSKIDNSAARMSSLIKDVLMYSKVSKEGKGDTHIDLNQILADVKNDYELLISQTHAQILCDGLPVLSGNTLHFYQLFSNLIGNSLKFTAQNPVIQITYRTIPGHAVSDLKTDVSKNYHELTFTDNGIGFEQIYADQIFGLFTRLHNKKEYEGTGIGLALCKKIVENQDGFIKAISTKGNGATFKIYFPVLVN